MNWIFINTDEPESLLESIKIVNHFSVYSFSIGADFIKIYYDNREWKEKPVIRNGNEILFISGWFLLKGKRNDLHFLLNNIQNFGLENTLNEIELGIFIGGYYDGQSLYVFNDIFSLSHHFVKVVDNKFFLAPFVFSLVDDSTKKDGMRKAFLNEYGYLLGDDTIYPAINRFSPGSVFNLSNGKQSIYLRIKLKKHIDLCEIPKEINRIVQFWHHDARSIALSSGFDSRLIYSQGSYKYVYTYGPEQSIDRKAAKEIFNVKGDNDSICDQFGFTEPETFPELLKLNELLVYGVKAPLHENFISCYYYSANRANGSYVAFDGFLGDVLQKGTYLYFKGTLGEIYKLFPFLFKLFPPSEKSLIFIRYKKFFGYAYAKYIEFLKKYNLKFSSIVSYELFEVFYGRTGRYIVNGGILINGIFKIVVPVFCSRVIFETILQENIYKVVNKRVFKDIWKNVLREIKIVKSEHLFSLATPRILIPFVALWGRILTHFFPKFYNYTKEYKLNK